MASKPIFVCAVMAHVLKCLGINPFSLFSHAAHSAELLANGSFETGLAGWAHDASVSLISAGVDGTTAANLGTFDFHPWPVRRPDVDAPDELRIDLDPVPGVGWPQIVDVALVARQVLEDYGLTAWPKTSGYCSLVLGATAGAQASNAPGVSDKAITLGYISSQTGLAASIFANAHKSCQARVGAENAKGGVNGRKIGLEIIDDQSGPANLTAAHAPGWRG